MVDTESVRKHIPFKLAILLLLFSFLVFADTINGYFLLDDFVHISSAKYNKLSHVLLGYETNLEGKFFRPVGMFFFWLQFKLFGPEPVIYNITVLLLHAFGTILAANLFYILFGNLRSAAIFGFVFIAFPNHTEAINWPAIHTLWATLFYLATLNFFACYRLSSRAFFLIMSLFSFLAAILSKEVAFTLPLSLLVLDFFLSRSRRISPAFGKRVIGHCAYFGLLLLVLLLTGKFLNAGAGYRAGGGEDFISRYLGNIYILVVDLTRIYLDAWKYLIAPVSPEIPYKKELIFLILLTSVLAGVLLLWKRRMNPTALAYCFAFAAITLLPVLGSFGLFGLSHWIRFLYLPSVGSCYIIAMILDGISMGTRKAWARYAFLGAAMIPMICLTKFYDGQWIKAQQGDRKIIETIVREFKDFPRYSRIYVSGIPWGNKGIPRIGPAFSAAIGLYFDREYIEASLNFLFSEIVLALDRERYEEHDWHYFWLAWDDQTGTLDVAGTIQPETNNGVPLRTWDFAEAGNKRRLEVATDINRVLVPGFPYPVFMIEDCWALLKLPPVGPGPPIKYLTLEMMLKSKKVGREVSRVFWVTEDDMKYTGEKSIGFYSMADEEFHEYKIPLYRNGLSLIDRHIVRFAVRPTQSSGTIFSIKKMTVEYY